MSRHASIRHACGRGTAIGSSRALLPCLLRLRRGQVVEGRQYVLLAFLRIKCVRHAPAAGPAAAVAGIRWQEEKGTHRRRLEIAAGWQVFFSMRPCRLEDVRVLLLELLQT